MVKEEGRIRTNTKPSKVVVVSVLSEYSLSEVTVSQFTVALNQNIHPLFTYTETAAGALAQHYGYCIVFLCVCLQMFLLLLYLQCPLGSVSDDNL